jgi:hypothetical protein
MQSIEVGDLVRLQKEYGWIGLYKTIGDTTWSSFMFDYETYVVLEVGEWHIRSVNTATGNEGWCGKTFVQRV